jgi:CubicO group peptidase (beta-lactamase class C family)
MKLSREFISQNSKDPLINFYIKQRIMKKNLRFSALILIFSFLFSLHAQDKSRKIDELVSKYHEYGQFSGAVLVSEGGNVIYKKGIGYANAEWRIPNAPDVKYRLGSITKQFTSMLIMQLVEKGKINLDGKLSEYLPYYRKDVGDKVTIHQLLTHTSGIPDYTDLPDFMRDEIRNPLSAKELIEKFCSGDPEFEPGTQWKYDNSGYVILGAVIEEVTGNPYETVLKENIIDQLEMYSTGYDHSEEIIEKRASGYHKAGSEIVNSPYIDMSLPFAAGALYSTVEDMYKWDQALYTDKLVSSQSKDKIFTPYMNNYGYGWGIREQEFGGVKKKVISHSGGIFGFNTIILRYVVDKNLIVLFCNVLPGELNGLSKGIANILYDQPFEMPKKSLAEFLMKGIVENGIEEAVKDFNITKENKAEYVIREDEMNMLGYQLLHQGKIKEAIEVFRLNTEAFPESYNVWDSYAEAFMVSGDKENAVKYYKKSLEINPESTSGKEALKNLEGK